MYQFVADTDGDGIQDPIDNCRLTANPLQQDANLDGYGNICDADINNSGTVTTADFGLLRSVLGQAAGFSATAAASDMNSSGTVTTADFGLLRARLGTAPGPSVWLARAPSRARLRDCLIDSLSASRGPASAGPLFSGVVGAGTGGAAAAGPVGVEEFAARLVQRS